MIALESVCKRYGGKTVVDDVSFTVERAEIVGFLGPNGAGKTTTLRMIAGVLTATSGRVTVAGCDMATNNEEAARRIGYAPERPALYEALDVRGCLRFVAKAKRVARGSIAAELERVVSACRLGEVFRKEIYKLSKGYRQRVGLAQALIGNPEVLLLDEPTAGLDPGQIQETRELIRSLGEQHAVLLSTHILAEATMICRRVAIIDRGRLLAIDSPETLSRASAEATCVALEVALPVPGLREALLAIEGVLAVAVSETDPGRRAKVLCQVHERDGIEAAIARVTAARWDLLRLERQRPTLEHVFLRYVQTPAEARA